MIEFKMEGNWSVPGDALRNLPKTLKSAGREAQKKTAEKIVKIAKRHIDKQDLGWKPRSERTNSADSRVLVDTEAYYRSIKAWKQGDSYLAGVPLGATNSKGVPIIIYALAHEYGYKVPRRPLWGPTYKEIGGRKGVKDIIKLAVAKKLLSLKRKGFKIT